MAPKGRVGMGGRNRSLKRMESPEFHLCTILGPTPSLPVTLVSFYSVALFGAVMALGFSLAVCGASSRSLSSWPGQPSPRMGAWWVGRGSHAEQGMQSTSGWILLTATGQVLSCSSLPVWSCWDLAQSGPLTPTLMWPRLLGPCWLLSGYLAPVHGVMRSQCEGQQQSEV
uniref:Uncharacterized protein n=1 Tax=Oryctolagus cuniculus TaxID=9986 RepID=A0A5F9DKJ2_RABIT